MATKKPAVPPSLVGHAQPVIFSEPTPQVCDARPKGMGKKQRDIRNTLEELLTEATELRAKVSALQTKCNHPEKYIVALSGVNTRHQCVICGKIRLRGSFPPN